MFTIILAAVDTFGQSDFNDLYIGTVLIDLCLVEALGNYFSNKKG